MQRSPRILPIGVILFTAPFLGSCTGAEDSEATRARDASGDVPTFTVDPSWPLEMPGKWIMGAVTAVFVDAQDLVWVTHLPETLTPEEISAVQDPPLGTCCVPAPVVIEFDAQGNVVQGWGDPATQDISEFPRNAHGLFIDHNDFVWIGTFRHHRVMKFTRSGELVMQIGEYEVTGGSNDESLLGGPSGIWVDPSTKPGDPGASMMHVVPAWRARRAPPNVAQITEASSCADARARSRPARSVSSSDAMARPGNGSRAMFV